MSTQTDEVAANYDVQLTKAIDAITKTQMYVDLKKMYENRQIEWEEYKLILLEMNVRAFDAANDFVKTIVAEDKNKDAKSDKELEILELERLKLQCEKDVNCIEKQILVEFRPINKEILEQDRDAKKETLLILKEQRPINKTILENNRDKLAKDIEVAEQQKVNLAQEFAIRDERRVPEMSLLAKDILGKQALYESETIRKLLLNRQTIGFDDNTIIKFAQVANETIGMIQSGGNEAPDTLWTQQATAMARLDDIAHR